MSAERIENVVKAIGELVSKNDSFLVNDGVWIISGNEANNHLNEGQKPFDPASLHLSTNDGHVENELSTERIAEILKEIEAEGDKFWMIHPKEGTLLTVENETEEVFFQTVDSYFVNPSAVQDAKTELLEFLDFLDNAETESLGAFPIWAIDGEEIDPDYIETILISSRDDTPADGLDDYEAEWLTFSNSDPYNSGDRRVQEELVKFARVLNSELDEPTIQRINTHLGSDIRKEVGLKNLGLNI